MSEMPMGMNSEWFFGEKLATHHCARIREAIDSLKMEVGEEPAELTSWLITSTVSRCLTMRLTQGYLIGILRSLDLPAKSVNVTYDALMEPMYISFQRDIDIIRSLIVRAYGLTEKQNLEIGKFLNQYVMDALKDVDAHLESRRNDERKKGEGAA